MKNGEAYFYANETAKQCPMQPVHWFNIQSTSDFISIFSKLQNRSLADYGTVTRGVIILALGYMKT